MNRYDAQSAVAALGYFDGPVDGDLRDPNWVGDLKRFQRDNRLDDDGGYGPKTDAVVSRKYAALMEAVGDEPSFKHAQRWQLTGYWIGEARSGSVPIKTPAGRELARVSPGSFVEAALEGTTLLKSSVFGRWFRGLKDVIANVASKPSMLPANADLYAEVCRIASANGWLPGKAGYAGIRVNDGGRVTHARTFEQVTTGPNGWPYWNRIEARPFRTLAADIGRIRRCDSRYAGAGGLVPVGTKVFILDLVGKKLPDGTTHDGWCEVNDTGAAIFGAHFDVFTGFRRYYKSVGVPHRGLIWFKGIEERVGSIDYGYGLA